MSAASDDIPPPEDAPTRALLLAQALDVCINAERRLPGSADHIIAHQPTWARDELRRLVSLAGSLDAVSTNSVMSDEFRVAARARLLQRVRGGAATNGTASAVTEKRWAISTFPSTNGTHAPTPAVRRKRRGWLLRAGVGGILAATLATTATLTASATALPGEPLYPIKQATEELGVRLAPDDQARAIALLNQGDARLNETARLLEAGRTTDIAQTTQQFNEAVDRATTTFVVTIAATPSEAPAIAKIETRLSAQQAELESLISSAPEPARADLRQALMATERGLALVADTQADQSVAQSAGSRTGAAAPVPTTAAEAVPTLEQPKVVQVSPPASFTVADSHDTKHSEADQPAQDPASHDAGSHDAAAQDAPAQAPAVRPERGLAAPRRESPRPATSQGGEKAEQHFEPVTTDSGAVAQAPQVSQQAPRHLDINLSDDAADTTTQSDAHSDAVRQVVVPTTSRGDDHPQVADQQSPSASAHAARDGASDESSPPAHAPASNTAQVPATPLPAASASDQRSTSSHGDGDKSTHGDSANASHGSSNDHSTRGGGDQGGKSNADQSVKSSGDSGGSAKGSEDGGGHGH